MTTHSQASRKVSEIDEMVGLNVRRARRSHDLTLQDLAKKLGMSYQQIQKYESGANRISVGVLAKIALALDTSVQDFFPDHLHNSISDSGLDADGKHLKNQAVSLLTQVKDQNVLASMVTVLQAIKN